MGAGTITLSGSATLVAAPGSALGTNNGQGMHNSCNGCVRCDIAGVNVEFWLWGHGHPRSSPPPSPLLAAALLTPAINGNNGYATFTSPVSAPNGFTVTYDASLSGGSNPPADGIMCYLHNQAAVTPSGGYIQAK
jgi:hypothetical protein